MSNTCPQCESSDVLVGAFVLECFSCGWHYLNKYPCRECGKPSRRMMGGNGVTFYGCAEHPFTDDEMVEVWRGFLNAIHR